MDSLLDWEFVGDSAEVYDFLRELEGRGDNVTLKGQ
jgi:hypothetical protein